MGEKLIWQPAIKLSNKFSQCVHVAHGRGTVLLWQRCECVIPVLWMTSSFRMGLWHVMCVPQNTTRNITEILTTFCSTTPTSKVRIPGAKVCCLRFPCLTGAHKLTEATRNRENENRENLVRCDWSQPRRTGSRAVKRLSSPSVRPVTAH